MSKSETLSPHIAIENSPSDPSAQNLEINSEPEIAEEPYHYQFIPEGQLNPEQLNEVAAQTMKKALQVPVIKKISENLEDGPATEQLALEDGGTALLRASKTPLGEELWAKMDGRGFVFVSTKEGSKSVDAKIIDGEEEIYQQSTAESPGMALDFLRELDEKIISDDLDGRIVDIRAGEEIVLQR